MSLFSLGSWIAEERKRIREEVGSRYRGEQYRLGQLAILRRLTARLRRGR